jgi:hypothetical protein
LTHLGISRYIKKTGISSVKGGGQKRIIVNIKMFIIIIRFLHLLRGENIKVFKYVSLHVKPINMSNM